MTKRIMLFIVAIISSIALVACEGMFVSTAILDKAAESLEIKTEVRENFTVPKEIDDITISWDVVGDGLVITENEFDYSITVIRGSHYQTASLIGTFSNEEVSKDIEFVITIIGEKHVVKFDVDGEITEVEVLDFGKLLVPERPTKVGFTFDGWYLDGKLYDFNKEVLNRFTLEAKWRVAEYTVAFVDHDGELLEVQTVVHGKGATTPNEPVRPGYTFVGWDKDFSNITKNTDVVALYKLTTFNVTFDVDGGTPKPENQTIELGEVVTKPNEPTKLGFIFLGWYLNDVAFDFETVIDNHIELEAKWEVDVDYVPETFTVEFVDFDGTVLKTEEVEINKSATAPNNPTRVGYTFDKWDVAFSNVTKDLTVTATYKINEYEVTFLDHEDNIIETVIVNYGNDAVAPQAPVREGYKFTGWDKDITNVQANLEVKALYEEIEESLLHLIDFEGETKGSYAFDNNQTTLGVENGLVWESTGSGMLWAYNDSQDENIGFNNGANISRTHANGVTLTSAPILSVTRLVLDAKTYGDSNSELAIFVKGDGDADFVQLNEIELTEDFQTFTFNVNRDNVQIRLVASKARVNLDNIRIYGYDSDNALDYHTVTYVIDQDVHEVLVKDGSKVAEPLLVPEKEGNFVFDAWKVNDVSYDFDLAVTDDLIIEAVFIELIEHDVTFIGFELEQLNIVQVQDGLTVAKPANLNEVGYLFLGWYLELTDEEEFDFDTPITKPTTIYGKFEAIPAGADHSGTYETTFSIVGNDKVLDGTIFELNPTDIFTVTNNKNSAHAGAKYFTSGNAARFYGHSSTNGSSLTIDLDEEYIIVSVEFIYPSSGQTAGNVTITTGTATLLNNVSRPVGAVYTFSEHVGADLNSITIKNTTSGTTQFRLEQIKVTIAKAGEGEPGPVEPEKYAVRFESNGGSVVADILDVEKGTTINKPTPNPTKGTDEFAGWFKDQELTTPWDFDTDVVNENITLYAKWNVDNGGEVQPKTITITHTEIYSTNISEDDDLIPHLSVDGSDDEVKLIYNGGASTTQFLGYAGSMRLYANASFDLSVTGMEIVSIKITWTQNKGKGSLTANDISVESNDLLTFDSPVNTVVLLSGTTGQARVSSIEVTYQAK